MKDTPGDIGVSHGNTTRRDRAAAGRGGRVTTAAVRAANRANAARSTGPRTRAGKVAVSRNALRHGLSLPVLADPALAPEIAALARRIAGEDASEARHAVAVRIAEAQVDVLRVRRLRDQVMAAGFTEDDITARLMRLDRYERRALSRRKSAIKAFDALQGAPAPRRRRDPWAAVAAAAGLRGFWQNKPDSRRRRNTWRAVAAAAKLGGFWQNKPDSGRNRGRLARLSARSRIKPTPSAAGSRDGSGAAHLSGCSLARYHGRKACARAIDRQHAYPQPAGLRVGRRARPQP